jgi:hypothetical protein
MHTFSVIMIQSVRLLREQAPASNIGAERDWGAPIFAPKFEDWRWS